MVRSRWLRFTETPGTLHPETYNEPNSLDATNMVAAIVVVVEKLYLGFLIVVLATSVAVGFRGSLLYESPKGESPKAPSCNPLCRS